MNLPKTLLSPFICIKKLRQILLILSILLISNGISFSAENHFKLNRLLYLPLDERFTTRDLFLSFVKITPFQIFTPDKSMLSRKKIAPDMNGLIEWTKRTSAESDAAIISADMLIYGGLIASRISNESFDEVSKRLKVLETIHQNNPRLPLLVSSTVMRMPAYSSAEEEPDYYAKYGREIFLFSQFTHRFEVLKNPQDKINAATYKHQIPEDILDNYLNRRTRNFEINKQLIELVKRNIINRLVITLDDNAEYGLSKKEAFELEKLSANYKDRIAIYPGADEAQLPLLSRLVIGNKEFKVYIVYRFPESKKLIPAFEGQPLDKSIDQQILAAGGRITESQDEADCILYVNNFKERQTFPPKDQTFSLENNEPLEELFSRAGVKINRRKVFIIADNNYYNGADTQLISSILKSKINSEQIAYGGWNTSGNTLGTAIPLGILRRVMKTEKKFSLQYKRLLWTRFAEDWVYMIEGREQIRADLKKRNLTDFAGNNSLETEYERQLENLFNSRAPLINNFLKTNFKVQKVFFPWHRPFEIGFEIAN